MLDKDIFNIATMTLQFFPIPSWSIITNKKKELFKFTCVLGVNTLRHLISVYFSLLSDYNVLVFLPCVRAVN